MEYVASAKLTEIKVAGVVASQAPDFVDAYVESCEIDGRKATEDELDYIFEFMPWVAAEAAAEALQCRAEYVHEDR